MGYKPAPTRSDTNARNSTNTRGNANTRINTDTSSNTDTRGSTKIPYIRWPRNRCLNSAGTSRSRWRKVVFSRSGRRRTASSINSMPPR